MAKLDLKLHPVKTKIVSMWDGKEGFDFLGMHHRRMTTETSRGKLYQETYQYPSKKAMKKMKTEIKRNVNSRSLLVAKEEDLIKNLNPKITGWKNYYSTKTNKKLMLPGMLILTTRGPWLTSLTLPFYLLWKSTPTSTLTL